MKKFTIFINYLVLVTPIVLFLLPFSTTADEELQTIPSIHKAMSSNGRLTVVTQVIIVATSSVPSKNKDIMTEIKFIPIEKVKMGTVESIDIKNNSLVIKIGSMILPVENNATTSFYFGSGTETKMEDIDIDMKIYVFGYIKSDNSLMQATKIVIANKSRLSRK